MIHDNISTTGHTTAITAGLAAVFNVMPTVLGIIGGILCIGWYGVLFYDRFVKKKAGVEAGP